MKRLIVLSLFIVLGTSVYAQNTGIKVGYVDAELILQQLPEYIKAEGDLKALDLKFKGVLDSVSQAFSKEVDAFEKEAEKNPNNPKLKEKQTQLANKQKSLQDLQLKMREDLFNKQQELMKPIQEKLYDNVEALAKEEGLQFIFNKKTMQDVTVMFADVQFDYTYKVLDRIRKSGK